MKKILFLLLLSLIISLFVQAAPKSKIKNYNSDNVAIDLANATVTAHGGEKFKNMKTLIVRGTAEVSGSPSMTISSAFAFVYAGEKYRIDITNPFQPLKQIYNGEETYSSINGFRLPPLNRLGLPLLQKIGTTGFVVSNLPEKFKGKKGFRVTSPESYYTDFVIDEKTGQVKSYESSYEVNGRNVTTSVEIDKERNVDGIIIPERYAQRFELGSITIFSDFKAKEILVNSEVSNDVFAIPR